MVSYKASLEKAHKIVESRKHSRNNTCNITSNSSAEAAYMLNLFFSQAMMNCGNYNFPKSGSSVKSTDKNSDETSAVPLGKGKDAPPENVENDNEENLSLEEKKNKVVELITTKRTDFNAESEFLDDLVSKYDLYKSCHDWEEDKIADRLNLYLKALEAHKTELKYGEIAQMNDKEKADQEMAEYNIVDEDIKGAMEKKNQDGTVNITDEYLNALTNRGVGYLDLYDTNGDEKISFDEFCALEAKDSGVSELGADEKAASQKYFNMMDKNNDNKLDANEMASHLFAVSRLYDGETNQPKNSADDIRFMEWYGAQDPNLNGRLSQASDMLYEKLNQ